MEEAYEAEEDENANFVRKKHKKVKKNEQIFI